jgi:HlyD family secretion protein
MSTILAPGKPLAVDRNRENFPNCDRPPRRRLGARGLFAISVFALATLAAIASYSGAFGWARQTKKRFVTQPVRRGLLEVKLTELGNLESADNLTLRSRVEGAAGTSVLRIAEEGSLVEKDQVVVELDSSRLRTDALVQEIKLETARAALKNATANLEIQKLQNASNIAAAELKLTLARLDLAKYTKGEYPQTRDVVLGEIKLAREYLKRARERHAFSERLLRRGFTTTKLLDADRVGVARARIDLESAEVKRMVLDEFTHKRDLVEMEANAELFDKELERVRLRAEKAETQTQVALLAAQRTAFLEQEKYNQILGQIEACTIRTPRAGLVVYANTSGGRRRSSGPLIYEGAVVMEHQALIDLPDVTRMCVSTRIHESKIAMVREGLPATVHLDARSGEVFHGVVTQVALVPISGSWPNPDRKEYTAQIKLTDEGLDASGLKPGMTADVEILSDRLDSALQVPSQACVERGGRYFAWVVEDGDELRRHEVTVGKSNEAASEVLAGLAEDDEVVLNPRSALPREIALLELEVLAAAEAANQWDRPKSATPADKPVESDRPERSSGETATGPIAAAKIDAQQPGQPESGDSIAVFNRLDQNGDAKVTESELPDRMKRVLSRMDTNGDKAIDRDEWKKGAKAWTQQSEGRSESGGGE